MNLIDLIHLFRRGQDFEEFCQLKSLDLTTEVVEIYMEKPFHIESQVSFFEIEKTGGRIEYTCNNKKYYNLFDFYFFTDFLQEFSDDSTNEDIAKRLIDYVINDA